MLVRCNAKCYGKKGRGAWAYENGERHLVVVHDGDIHEGHFDRYERAWVIVVEGRKHLLGPGKCCTPVPCPVCGQTEHGVFTKTYPSGTKERQCNNCGHWFIPR
jgi:hypothetical protein